jgi:hypothetical protein
LQYKATISSLSHQKSASSFVASSFESISAHIHAISSSSEYLRALKPRPTALRSRSETCEIRL